MANLKISLRKKGASDFGGGDKLLPETDWAYILNKPPTFVPDPHGHAIADITNLQTTLNGKAASTHDHPTNAIWTGNTYNIVNGLTPHIKSLFPMTKANKLAFLNPNAITIEGTDDGTTWTVLGYGSDRKVDLFSNKNGTIFFGNSLTGTSTGYTNNSKTRITIDQTLDGRYFGGWCNTVIEMTSSGAASPTVTIEVQRKNVPGWHMIANKIPINGWSGINDIGHANITFGSSFDGQDQKVRFTFEIGAVADGATYGRATVLNISAYGDSMWSAVNNMSRSDKLYDYDYLQNAYFPNQIYANNKILAKEEDVLIKNAGGVIGNKIQLNYQGALTYSNVGMEIREREQVGSSQSSNNYAPAIGFHWGNRYGAILLTDANGILRYGSSTGSAQSIILGDDPRLTNSRIASDVYSWAKAVSKPSYVWSDIGSKPTWIGSDKPSYSWSEIGSKPSVIIEGDARLTNSRIASDVYSWAKAVSKPSYDLDQISDGTTYKRVTQTEKNTWNDKWKQIYAGTSAALGKAATTTITVPSDVYAGKVVAIEIRYGSNSTVAFTNKIVFVTLGTNDSPGNSKTEPRYISFSDFDGQYIKNISTKCYVTTTGATTSISFGYLRTLIGSFSGTTIEWTTQVLDSLSVYIGKMWVLQ